MKSKASLFVTLFALAIAGTTGCQQETANSQNSNDADSKSSRSFAFNYGATILDVPTDATVRVWYPIAQSNGQQEVSLAEKNTPTEMQINRDEKYDNQIGYFEVKPDTLKENQIEFVLKYDVVRHEASVDDAAKNLTDEQKSLFLAANSLVPVDGKPTELLKDKELVDDSMAAGKQLYEIVEDHMKYDKSQPGYGNGDSAWACDSKTGNCTDFHSLFISLARNQKIPARFEIGFPLPPKKDGDSDGQPKVVKGYHCWAWFHSEGKGWAPVDISEADKHPEMKEYYFGKLTQDRVAFSTGRDIELVPAASAQPLNYLVYPHVEVDGKLWPKDKIKLNFSYTDK